VPDFIKRLGDVKEGRRAVGFAVKGVMDCVYEAMSLFGSGVATPEAELVGRE
jgi:hypothetical protein